MVQNDEIPREISALTFFVNGKKVIDKNVDPEWTLLYYLRNNLKLCGTKLGCAEGGCGACTVMVSKYDRVKDKLTHFAVNACLAPVCSMHGLAVTTVEGIGSTKTRLHPVQERIAKAHGSQCGFCTPGIVMSMYALLRSMPKPSMKDMEVAFQGNLCRCTGYRPIIEGYKTFTEDWELMQSSSKLMNGKSCGMGDKCCKVNGNKPTQDEELFEKNKFTPYDASQEPIFPPELKLNSVLDTQALYFQGKNVTWYRPTNMQDLVEIKSKYNDAKIIVGNTEVGVEVKFKNCLYPVLIQPVLIQEMNECTVVNDGLKIGASVTLGQMESLLKEQINTLPEYKTRIFKAIIDMLHWFGGKQIRSVASIGGNIMTGSPISDLNPIFMASKVKLELKSVERTRVIRMDEKFFTGYRQNIVNVKEILVSIIIPFTTENQYFCAYKQAKRREDDIAIVNCAINVFFKENTDIIEDIDLAFGGMAPTTVLALQTKQNLKGLKWDEAILDHAYTILLDDLPLVENAPGGMIEYRKTLPLCFFFRAYLSICQKLQIHLPDITINPKNLSAIDGFQYKVPKSAQYYRKVPETQEIIDTIGRPIVHMSAYKQATGEALYCDDIPSYDNELYLALVYSTKAHANIKSIDASKALVMEGVVGFICAEDLEQENNKCGFRSDEEVFRSKTVTSQYQVVGAIVAEDQLIARKATKKVIITYEELFPIIITVEDAIKNESFLQKEEYKLELGNVDQVFNGSKHIIEGTCRSGNQEHFYLETHAVLVVPIEEGMEIFCSTQHQADVTASVAKLLNIPQNKIITRVKRIGGGFGGKENKWTVLTLPAAVAARKYNRPIRSMLDRDEDMLMTGGRNPFYSEYKVAFDETGKILAYDVKAFLNCGYSFDSSNEVMNRGLFAISNSYKIPNCRFVGKMCKTNLPSTTAFRGFGSPQGMFITETMLHEVADYLKKDYAEVVLCNLYDEVDTTNYKQLMENCNIRKCVNECLLSSNYYQRKMDIEKYNSENSWKKRGISLVPDTYGVGFGMGASFLVQGGCLVLVYTDGSVLLSHGGVEMGQGLHTKMIQVASRVLQISVDKIHISETSTDKVPNTSPSAGSMCSDLYGAAVLSACETINERIEPIKAKNPKGTWEEWVQAAYLERISLSATGFYKSPLNPDGFNFETKTGTYYQYFTYGAACTEVEIDCLTGDHQVLRTDIVMDLGESLNPAIDVGQIEGAFMQGYGLFVMEEMLYSPKGDIYTRGPGAYKIPGFSDIPIEFNVSLLMGSSNPRAVYSSKAVGEPPLFLASSVLFAIKEGIKSARADTGLFGTFKLDAPATSAKIRMACQDHITSKISVEKGKNFVPWNILPEA